MCVSWNFSAVNGTNKIAIHCTRVEWFCPIQVLVIGVTVAAHLLTKIGVQEQFYAIVHI